MSWTLKTEYAANMSGYKGKKEHGKANPLYWDV